MLILPQKSNTLGVNRELGNLDSSLDLVFKEWRGHQKASSPPLASVSHLYSQRWVQNVGDLWGPFQAMRFFMILNLVTGLKKGSLFKAK
jgi:hypothetical protein